MSEKVEGKLVIMGNIAVAEGEGEIYEHEMALLIEFDNAEDIRQAIKDGEVKFTFGDT